MITLIQSKPLTTNIQSNSNNVDSNKIVTIESAPVGSIALENNAEKSIIESVPIVLADHNSVAIKPAAA